VGEWNGNGGGTARTEGRDRFGRLDRLVQPEFLPGAAPGKPHVMGPGATPG
jgi:hypothetical protein